MTEPKPQPSIDEMTRELASGMTLRIEQTVRMVVKPKPWYLTERAWMRIAAHFVYIEKTQPSLTLNAND